MMGDGKSWREEVNCRIEARTGIAIPRDSEGKGLLTPEYMEAVIEWDKAHPQPVVVEDWIADTPWAGHYMAVSGATRQEALDKAEKGRAAHIAKLEAEAARWRGLSIHVQYCGDAENEGAAQ